MEGENTFEIGDFDYKKFQAQIEKKYDDESSSGKVMKRKRVMLIINKKN